MNTQVRIETYERLQELLRAKMNNTADSDERAAYEYLISQCEDEIEFWNERSGK